MLSYSAYTLITLISRVSNRPCHELSCAVTYDVEWLSSQRSGKSDMDAQLRVRITFQNISFIYKAFQYAIIARYKKLLT